MSEPSSDKNHSGLEETDVEAGKMSLSSFAPNAPVFTSTSESRPAENREARTNAQQQEQAALYGGLSQLPAPRSDVNFNAHVLAALVGGQDYAPWPQQVRIRLHWMALPALGGFALFCVLALCNRATLRPPVFAVMPDTGAGSAPALPSLPTVLPRVPKRPSQAKAAVSATGGMAISAGRGGNAK